MPKSPMPIAWRCRKKHRPESSLFEAAADDALDSPRLVARQESRSGGSSKWSLLPRRGSSTGKGDQAQCSTVPVEASTAAFAEPKARRSGSVWRLLKLRTWRLQQLSPSFSSSSLAPRRHRRG